MTSAGIVPSLLIGAAAFGASELLLGDNKKEEIATGDRDIKLTLAKAKEDNKNIRELMPQIEDRELQNYIIQICTTTDRIINTVNANPHKFKKAESFFDYYLPVTLKIIRRYDEIENQRLTSKDSQNFMIHTKELLAETNRAFDKQLSSLYQADIVDIDAEMKVFDMMLKADGLDSNSINNDK